MIRSIFRSCLIWVTLTLGAWPLLALDYYRPLQFDVVLKEEALEGRPFIFSISIATLAAGLIYWVLWANNSLSRWRALLTATFPLALLGSVMLVAGVTVGVVTGAIISVAALGTLSFLLLRCGRSRLPSRLYKSPWAAAIVGIVFYGTLTIASIYDPIGFPRNAGALTIITAFIGVIVVLLVFCIQRPRVATVAFLYIVIAVFFFPANNHKIPEAAPKNGVRRLDDAFLDWALHRKDLDTFRKAELPYPVLFVSSEGGGIYAAAHAYNALSVLSAHCPTFLQHVFALVGVSGGAIGNALLASEAPTAQSDASACQPTSGLATVHSDPLTADHLSPVLARLLFVELVERLQPIRWPVRDRAQILADSFLSVAGNKSFLQTTNSDSFDTGSARPAVVSVATNVADGRRFVISPFAPDNYSGGTGQWWPGVDETEDDQKWPAWSDRISGILSGGPAVLSSFADVGFHARRPEAD